MNHNVLIILFSILRTIIFSLSDDIFMNFDKQSMIKSYSLDFIFLNIR